MSKNKKHPPFVMVQKQVLECPAWRAMSMGARVLYIALKRRYNSNFHNNGRIYLSQRDAAKEIGSHQEEITRWFRELQHYGFIVMTQRGCLGLDGAGRAPHWRLTECGYMKELPTNDFLRWNGIKFRRRQKQDPVPEIRDAHVPEVRDTNVPGIRDTPREKRPGNPVHAGVRTEPEIRDITSIPS